jgi:O-antigen ligase
MNDQNKIFDALHGADKLKQPISLILIAFYIAFASLLAARSGILITLFLFALPFLLFYLLHLFKKPIIGFWTVFVLNYFILGITRYIPESLGLTVDIMLILTYIALIFRNFYDKLDWSPARNELTLLAAIWYLYALFQLFNPEAASRQAWFYAMRGVALYMILSIPLAFMFFNKIQHLNTFFLVWAVFSIIGTLKGIMQQSIGLDPWEQRWLDSGGYITHLLFGKLRIFSFFSDAGQFGASQGHAGVVFVILALNTKNNRKLKYFYWLAGLMGLYGMMISGTRGAIAVPAAGFTMYLFFTKNLRVLFSGLLLLTLVFVFLKFTTIGQGNYTINRMRTALDPNNASLQVRKDNQRILKGYLASRPFGGGIGAAGNWGQRFSPHTFLANVPTDSWYVMIWAEQGIVGLLLHLLILLYIVIKGSYIIMFRLKNRSLAMQIGAINAGLIGILLASYGNGVLGQMPTGIIVYIGMAFIFMAPKLEKELEMYNDSSTNKTQEHAQD